MSDGQTDGFTDPYNTIIRDVPDTTLPDTGFNRIVVYRIPDTSKVKHNSQRMNWEYYCQCSLQLKFKQNMYVCVFTDLNKTGTSLVVYK